MGSVLGDSFEVLVDEARPRLWRGFVAARGVDGADDAVGEALAWAWEHRERLVAMDNPIGYLYRVGLTRSIPRATPVLPLVSEVEFPSIEPALIPALLALPKTQRAAVWLVHGCGWSYAEVAEALDVGRSTVGTHLSRGMAKLRKRLEVTVNG